MKAYIKLFRPINLLLLILTQYLVLFYLIRPIFMLSNYDIVVSHFDFALFVLSNVLLAAAGYAILDYYDIEIADASNQNSQQKIIPKKKKYMLNMVLNTIACLLGFYCAFRVGNFKLGFLPLVIALALFYYSLKYKRQFLTGNIVIGLVVAYSIMVVWLFQFFAIKSDPLVFAAAINCFKIISVFVGGMAVLGFLLTLILEMLLSIKDRESEKLKGFDTIAIRLGVKKTQKTIQWLSIFTMLILAVAQYFLFEDYPITTYYFFVLQFMFIYFLVTLRRAVEISHYQFLSNFLKIMMLAGLLSTQMLSINF